MAKRSTEEVGVNMTPMIDIVFQLIIFFVVTIELDRQVFNQNIALAFSPHGPAIEKKNPLTVVVEVDERGTIMIGHNRLNEQTLYSMLAQAVARWRPIEVPVQIRGDKDAKHESVRRVMEACGKAGIYRVSFVAIKEKAAGAGS